MGGEKEDGSLESADGLFLDLVGARRLERIDEVLAQRTRHLCIVLENLHDPHNLAAAFRTADAFGVQEVYVLDRTGDFTLSGRITQGCHKWLDGAIFRDVDGLVAHLRGRGFRILAAALAEGSVPLPEVEVTGEPLALVFGNEHAGLTPELVRACDAMFMIPMRGFSQSLNVSISVAVTLERLRSAFPWPALEGEDRAALRARWAQLSANQSRRIAEAVGAEDAATQGWALRPGEE